MAEFTIKALAKVTQRNYDAFIRYYLNFCDRFGRVALCPSDETLQLYVAFRARTCSYRTIKSYLNGVRIVHLEAGLANPILGNYNLERTLRGIKRAKSDVTPHRKLAITLTILKAIIQRLDLFDTRHVALAAAMVVAFFAFLRKANLVPSGTASDPVDDMSPVRRSDITFAPDNRFVWLQLRRTKTIQFRLRILRIPLPAIPGSILCPVTQLRLLFDAVPASPDSFAFSFCQKDGRLAHLTHRTFVQSLEEHLGAIDLDASRYSGHSFRRGGATFAFKCGAPPGQIQNQGDWKSACYLMYLEFDDSTREKLATLMRDNLLGLGGVRARA